MSYATRQDLIDRFGERELIQLTDETNRPPSAIDDTMVGRALDDADGEINGYLKSAGIVTPMAAPPSVLVVKACFIARYYLYRRGATEQVRKDYEDARSWLRDVAMGKVSLGDKTAPAAVPSQGPIKIVAPPRRFTDSSMDGL